MRKPIRIIGGVLILAAFSILALPSLMDLVPSRYVAAYVPEPIQALMAADQPDVLPTAALVPSDALNARPTSRPPSATPEPAVTQEQAKATPSPSPTATAEPTNTPIPIQPAMRVEPFTHQFQTWNNCGPATLAMALSHFGPTLSQERTAAVLKPNPEDRNVSPQEMAGYVNEQTENQAITRTNGDLDQLRRFLSQGMAVIVELGLDPPGDYRWMGWYGHYLLLVAYDDASQTFWAYDSWLGTSGVPGENANDLGRPIAYGELDRYWRQFNRNYIVLYRPEQANVAAGIIGPPMDDAVMWQQSLERAEAEQAAEPNDPFLWFNLGTIYNALGEYEQAAEAFDQARTIGLPWRMLWYQFGPFRAYFELGRYEDVILLTDLTLDGRPYFEESFYYRGLAYEALGETFRARQDFERAYQFNSNYTPAAEALARLDGAG
ncbi:MAG: C39 family peptidase [Candidatus Promineifilaceae bacterium]